MSSRVVQRHAAGSYDSCGSRVSASGRLAALVAALMIALATLFVGTAMPQQASAADDSQTNFDSWTEVAQNIAKQLATAENDYNDGNYSQAVTDFQTAHWIGYDASNFSKAVNDTISADKQQALLTQFTDLEGLAYQQSQGGAIAGKIDALNADLTATAQTLDGNANLADPKTYASLTRLEPSAPLPEMAALYALSRMTFISLATSLHVRSPLPLEEFFLAASSFLRSAAVCSARCFA